jgi:DNA polymerase-1
VAIVRAFRAANLDAHIIAQIHDELIVECKESDKDLVGALVRDCMENTTKIKVPLTAVPSFGYNFKEAKGG